MDGGKLIVTTTDEVGGRRVSSPLGMVIGFSHAHVFDLKSYRKMFEDAMGDMVANASAAGAHAVVKVRVSHSVVHERHLCFQVRGTAVRLEDAA